METYEALKTLFNSGDVLGNVSDAVKHSYIDRIDQMEAQYQKAEVSGSLMKNLDMIVISLTTTKRRIDVH